MLNGIAFRVVPVVAVNAHLFPFLLPLPLDFGEVVFFRQRLHASQFPFSDGLGKLKYT